MAEDKYIVEIIGELQRNAGKIAEEELKKAADFIKNAERVFIAGAGRSGFAARAMANRCMHLGLTVFFVGEPTTPAIRKGDLLLIGSGSGETASLVVMARKALREGAKLLTVTIHPEASIGTMADAVITLPGITPKGELTGTCTSIQPMGNLFEQLTWIVYDAIIMHLMAALGKSEDEMFALHANLE